MIVYAIETFPMFSTDWDDSGIIGIYRTLEGARKALAEMTIAAHLYADIVDYEVQD